MDDCKHNWQPAKDLAKGRYRCASCESIGYKDPRGSGKIIKYVTVPDWVQQEDSFESYESYYPVRENGRCPSMDDQERMLINGNNDLEDFDG